jgi:hypothetical protein
VFGFSAEGAAPAELAVLSFYAPIPPSLDVAGSGVLPELIELADGPEHVVTIADFAGAQEHGKLVLLVD